MNYGSPLVYGSGVAAGLPNGAPALNRNHRFYFTGRSDNFDPAQLSNGKPIPNGHGPAAKQLGAVPARARSEPAACRESG